MITEFDMYKATNHSENTPANDAPSDLQWLARQRVIMHFTRADAYTDSAPTVMVKEDCWLIDDAGSGYPDALAGLFCVNIGYSHGAEIGEVVKAQMTELPFYANWGYTHPPSIRLAADTQGMRGPR